MDNGKYFDANIDVFNCLMLGLANCNAMFSYEHNVVILLNSLPDIYKDVINT